jgi:hypothetical protein
MKTETFQLRGNNSVCVGSFPLLRGRTAAQLRGNIAAIVTERNTQINNGLRIRILKDTTRCRLLNNYKHFRRVPGYQI